MKLTDILANIDQGQIVLPEFQRGYVWNRGQVRELMGSMYREYPVGSLLTWQTAADPNISRGASGPAPGVVSMLLDGQQRVTSLYGVLRGESPPFFQGNDAAFKNLRFHLDREVFELHQPLKMQDDDAWIDVTSLFRKGAGPLIGKLWGEAQGDEAKLERMETWTSRINRLAQVADRDFHIETVLGPDKTLDVVVDIFNRVNSGGTKLSSGDLALAKLCASWPQARDALQDQLAIWAAKGYSVKIDWFLRAITAVLTGRASFSALDTVDIAAFKDGLKLTTKAIERVLNAAASRLGIDHGQLLPSAFAVIPIARYLATRQGTKFDDDADRDRWLFWYLHAAMWGRYSGSVETALAQDLTSLGDETGSTSSPVERLVLNLRQQRGDLVVHPGDFGGSSRGNRFFPVLYVLTRTAGPRDWGNGERLSKQALGSYSDLELHHIFPKARLKAAGRSTGEINALANFTFLTHETNQAVTDNLPRDYIPEYEAARPGVVAGHWISTDPKVLEIADYPVFLERRRALLAGALNELLDALWAGAPGEAVADVENPTVTVGARDPSWVAEDVVLDECDRLAVAAGFPRGVRNHELVSSDSSVEAVLDLAWPAGLQTDLSQPLAVLINEADHVSVVAAQHGYRPVDSVHAFAEHLETLQ